jgi:hypothetical protein
MGRLPLTPEDTEPRQRLAGPIAAYMRIKGRGSPGSQGNRHRQTDTQRSECHLASRLAALHARRDREIDAGRDSSAIGGMAMALAGHRGPSARTAIPQCRNPRYP